MSSDDAGSRGTNGVVPFWGADDDRARGGALSGYGIIMPEAGNAAAAAVRVRVVAPPQPFRVPP